MFRIFLLLMFCFSSLELNAQAIEGEKESFIHFLPNIYLVLLNSEKLNDEAESAYKLELKNRFENGYVTGAGFSDDIAKAISDVAVFTANPGEFRPTFGGANNIINRGQILHTTAVYAYAVDDVNVANIVATEILATINNNNLYSQFWLDVIADNTRWDGGDFNGWIQAAKAKKLKDSYYFIESLQNSLTTNDKKLIEAWFERFAELAYTSLSTRLSSVFGNDWVTNGRKKWLNILYPTSATSSTATPIFDQDGNVITPYIMSVGQDSYNNRNWDVVAYIHSWAVKNNDLEKEIFARQFFKSWVEFASFSDGTLAEMWRNVDRDPTLGVFYGWISVGAAVQLAHNDALSGHFPDDRLYDYKTTDGIINGSVTLTNEAYTGGSTTDSVTEKSLFKILRAQSNYLRGTENGGWSDARFFKLSDNSVVPLSTAGLRQPSTIPAIANLYYKSQDLKDLYLYNTVVGYPAKVSISEGYLAGTGFNEDAGPWGNMIMGAMWLEMEDYFFTNLD